MGSPDQVARRRRPDAYGPWTTACAVVTVFLLTLCTVGAADAPPAIVHHWWDVESGLPQNTVNSIVQTADGYLWVATNGGLVRFDGVRFVPIRSGGPGDLAGIRITTLCEGPDGTLWVGSEGAGLGRVVNEHVAPVPLSGLSGPLTVLDLALGLDGSLVVATASEGVLRLHGPSVQRVSGPAPDPGHVAGRVLPDGHGGFWMGTDGGDLLALRGGTTPVPLLPERSRLGPVTGLARAGQGAAWASAWGGRLFLVRGDTAEVWPDARKPFPARAICADGDGLALAAATDGGVYRLRLGEASHELIAVLPGVVITCMVRDREGSLWVGTQAHGLHQVTPSRFTVVDRAAGLPEDAIHGVLEDRAGDLWFGAGCSGLFRLRHGATEPEGPWVGPHCVWALEEAAAGGLWVGTYGAGVWRVEGERSRQVLPAPTTTALALHEDSRGTLWVGSTTDGLLALSGNSVRRWTTADGLPANDVRTIVEAPAGSLWVGTAGGLARLETASGRVEAVPGPDGKPIRSVRAVQREPAGRLWVGSYGGGLTLIDGPRAVTLDASHGLEESVVSWLAIDREGWLWLTGNKGIYRVVAQDAVDAAWGDRRLSVLRYGEDDGLPTSEANGGFQPAGCLLKDGRLAVPTVRGLALFDPSRWLLNRVRPRVRVEDVVVDGVRRHATPHIDLSRSDRRIEVHYTSLSFVAPQRARFRVRLEGFDPDWIDVGAERTVAYTSLAPGRYIFRVTASNGDGVWSADGAAVGVVRHAAFVETWAFRVLVIAAFALVAVGGNALRHAALRRRAAVLKDLVSERTAELLQANERLAELATTDALTGLANPRAFRERLGEEWRRAIRSGHELSLIMGDVDRFKEFNDSQGHLAGDECLRQVAEVLASVGRRAGDVVARYGGEEFVMLLPETSINQAVVIAEGLREQVAALGIPHTRSSHGKVTISFGVATLLPRLDLSPDRLVGAADRALYHAKAAGRNRVVAAEPAAVAV